MFDLGGRVGLVTGGGQGVGAAIARGLAHHGAHVAINDLHLDRAEAVAAGIDAAGGRAMAVAADVTDRDAVDRLVVSVVEELGEVDVLVNNAGVPASGLSRRRFLETDRSDWEPMLALNLLAVMQCSRAVLEPMVRKEWGRIITIVSDAGRVGEPGMTAYSAAKAGAMGFSRALAREVGPSGVTSNCVSLGSIAPPGSDDDRRLRRAAERYPMRRLGVPDDVTAAVVWLASPAASWVTAQTIAVDGGFVPS